MLQKIASIMGIENAQNAGAAMDHLNRVASKIPAGVDGDDPAFSTLVEQAISEVEQESKAVFAVVVSTVTAEPVKPTLKIKSSPKGSRIKVAAVNGVHFSFGPIWNESVKKAKGIAVAPANRTKLNHQASMLGIDEPESLEPSQLCAQISTRL
jgi:hypothetical protein